MDEKIIESREYLMKLYKGVYSANSGVGRQALARIDNTLANLRIRNNNLQEQLDKYKEIIEEVREYNNQIIKDTKDFYRPTEDTIYSGDTLIDLAETNIQILDKAKEL